MIEDIHLQPIIQRTCEKCIARAQAGSDDAQILEALVLEPVEAGSSIDNGLTRRIDRPADIG